MRITLYRLTSNAKLDSTDFRKPSDYTPVPLKKIDGLELALYLKNYRPAKPVSWVEQLKALVVDPSDLDQLSIQSSGAILLAKRKAAKYALSFGTGFQALDPTLIERGFGVGVTANAIAGSAVKSADTRGLNREGRSAKVIVPVESELADLGIDPTQEWVRQLSGTVTSTSFATSAAGADSLRLNIRDFSLRDLDGKLKQIQKYWKSDKYKKKFPYLDNFIPIGKKDPLLPILDSKADDLVRARDPHVFFAPPEPFDQLSVELYELAFRKRRSINELTQSQVYSVLDELNLPTVDVLRKVKVKALDGDEQLIDKIYSLYEYVQAELQHDGDRYVLSAGIWFRIDDSYLSYVDAELKKIEDITDTLALPGWFKDAAGKFVEEGEYNEKLAEEPDRALLDKKNLSFGQYQQVEICDVVTKDRELICVKRATRSSALSHLFAQGSVSSSLMHEPAYIDKLLKAARTTDPSLDWGHADQWKIVYAVGTEKPGALKDTLFFFSRVNLITHVKQIRSTQVQVALARIDMS